VQVTTEMSKLTGTYWLDFEFVLKNDDQSLNELFTKMIPKFINIGHNIVEILGQFVAHVENHNHIDNAGNTQCMTGVSI